tara:strand:+ start:9609 stop:10073 length:465 start_codon:yes stop_codon:yes gene_type:complete
MIIKMTAPQEPTREWSDSIQFARGTQDSTIVTNYKNAITHTPRDFRSIRWMNADNKTMWQIIIGTQAWCESEWNNYFKPHVDAGKLTAEKVVEQQVTMPIGGDGKIAWNTLPNSEAGGIMEKLIEELGADWKDSALEGSFDWTQFEEWPSNFPG